MIINSTKFKDLKVIKCKKLRDLRGEFIKVLNTKKKLDNFKCYESYISISKKGAARGLHGQKGKFSQNKVVFCIRGKVLDLALDLRKGSKTYGKVFKKIISSRNLLGIFIPKGFVHGIIALENNSTLINYSSSAYKPSYEYGINVKSLKLNLPKMSLLISKKDKKLPGLDEFMSKGD